jgi:hypothetical protein
MNKKNALMNCLIVFPFPKIVRIFKSRNACCGLVATTTATATTSKGSLLGGEAQKMCLTISHILQKNPGNAYRPETVSGLPTTGTTTAERNGSGNLE